MATLNQKELLGLLLRAIDASGWKTIILSESKPFRFRVFQNDEKGFTICVYIWNCTHGGGKARAKDEYRVQLTGVVPNITIGELTLLLGWHEGYGVFVAFDINKHVGQVSQSPSIQVKESSLSDAHQHAFAIYLRHNGEIAVVFRPEFFVDYALNAPSLHMTGQIEEELTLLNTLDTLTDDKISTVSDTERRSIISKISRKYRAQDFRRRILGAYGHRCAMCTSN